jgi:hypothetical protein
LAIQKISVCYGRSGAIITQEATVMQNSNNNPNAAEADPNTMAILATKLEIEDEDCRLIATANGKLQ